MQFKKISAALLGLAAFAFAIPHPQPEAGAVDRRLKWTPRSLRESGSNSGGSIIIIDTTIVELNEQSRNSEVELTIIVQERIRSNHQKKTVKDNVRRNHYRNKNRSVNTIIIVITEIIDIRNSNNHNKRYMRHQIRADNGQHNDVIVQVTEVVAITVSNSNRGFKRHVSPTGTVGNALEASAAVANAIQTVDPNAPFQANNQTMILPSGTPPPSGQTVEFDPAAIVENVNINLIIQQVSN